MITKLCHRNNIQKNDLKLKRFMKRKMFISLSKLMVKNNELLFRALFVQKIFWMLSLGFNRNVDHLASLLSLYALFSCLILFVLFMDNFWFTHLIVKLQCFTWLYVIYISYDFQFVNILTIVAFLLSIMNWILFRSNNVSELLRTSMINNSNITIPFKVLWDLLIK
jgi:hypothetical protein